MLRALYTSATGMKAQEMMIDNTANNLANVNTTAFKRSRMDFADMFYSTYRQPGTAISDAQVAPTGLQIGNGVRAVATNKHFAPGSMEETHNPLDMAIKGDGFFQLRLPNGEMRYSRAGNFRIDSQSGQLVNADGLLLDPPITISDGLDVSKITISMDGRVQGVVSGSDQAPVDMGIIQLFAFLNPAGLSSEGGNLYAANDASGVAIPGNPATPGYGEIQQGYLENSNVEVVTELIALISAQRAYEINARAIRAGDEMLSTSVQIVR